jgi:hypothetical protein
MNNTFYNQIAKITAHRPIRDVLSSAVLRDRDLYGQLMDIALNVDDQHHHKACWILELVMEAKIKWLEEHSDSFCNSLSRIKHYGALRSISKICLFAVKHNLNQPGFLTAKHADQITESCFDWLIDPAGKVATKAYAMRTLYILGMQDNWIYPELKRILSEDASKHSAAYIAAAKDILKRIGT